MFEGRKYKKKGGYRENAIRFADADGGVATREVCNGSSHYCRT